MDLPVVRFGGDANRRVRRPPWPVRVSAQSSLHGGEPLLLGAQRLLPILTELRSTIRRATGHDLSLQTNGVLLTPELREGSVDHRERVSAFRSTATGWRMIGTGGTRTAAVHTPRCSGALRFSEVRSSGALTAASSAWSGSTTTRCAFTRHCHERRLRASTSCFRPSPGTRVARAWLRRMIAAHLRPMGSGR